MANRIDDNRLLPCPFCGEEAAIWYFPQHDRPLLKEAYYVGCTNDNCGCEMEHPGGYKSLDNAVSAWNMRAKEPTTKNDSSGLEKNSKKLEKRTTKNDLTEQCIACKYDETEDENGEHCKKCLEGGSQFELDEALAKPSTKNDLGVDCISRQAISGYIDYILSHGMGKKKSFGFIKKFVDKLPSVTPQLSVPEVTALAEWTEKLTKASEDAYNKGYADGMKAQEPKTGHWMLRNSFLVPYKCSECNYKSERYDNYCPNCGAKMVEPQESEGNK